MLLGKNIRTRQVENGYINDISPSIQAIKVCLLIMILLTERVIRVVFTHSVKLVKIFMLPCGWLRRIQLSCWCNQTQCSICA